MIGFHLYIIFLLTIDLFNGNFYFIYFHLRLANFLGSINLSYQETSDIFFVDELLVEFCIFYLFEGRPFLWVVAKHFHTQVLEVLWARSAVDFAPVLCEVAFLHQAVEIFIFFSFSEWENSLNQNEEDDSSWENIDFCTIISFPRLNLWGHIRLSSEILTKSIEFFRSKTKINNFDVHFFVYHNVL